MKRIDQNIIKQIKGLLKNGVRSAREIGRIVGINHHTANKYVDLIKNGGLGNLEDDNRVYEKCPTCGGKVLMPCIACRAEEFAQLKI